MNIVSIVLLSHNWKKFNKDCINSVLVQNYQDFEIVFVDNCSTDWSLEEVENLYKNEIKNWKIKIVKNSEDSRFTWWNNFGVKFVDKDSKYICLLSNDIVVQKNWLEELVKWIESDDKLWAVSCLILDRWYEEKIKHQMFENKKKCMSSVFWESIFTDMKLDEFNSKFYYTTTLCGGCFMYKKWIVDVPFPEYYFAYAEDIYLSWLIINNWYKLWVSLNTFINHYWSWTFGRNPSPMKLFHWNKNQIINFLLFYPLVYRVLLSPLFLIKEIAHLFMGSPLMRLKAKIKWIIRIFNNYDKIRETRGFINKNKKISNYAFIKQLIFWLTDPFFVDSMILKVLTNIGNILFEVYGRIIIGLLSIVSTR